MKIRTLIVDDEVLSRRGVEIRLRDETDFEIIAQCANGREALAAVQQLKPDLVFLDIQMPGMSGFEVLAHLPQESMPLVVFVTAYDQYAVAAFEEGAVDYVMKPLSAARLATACGRVKKRLTTAPADLDRLLGMLARHAARAQPYLRWINASQGTDVRLITVEEICYFQSDTKYTRAVTSSSESLIRRSLKELLEELDPSSFWQIHRSTVVNVNAIAGVSRDFAGRLFVKLKTRKETLPVSQPFAHLFRQM